MIILIGIVTGLVKLTALVVSKIKGDDTQKTNKVLNNTSSVAVKEDASSAEDKKRRACEVFKYGLYSVC
ncbi:MAG: hypothetical protein ACLS5M_13170 [Ruminococcus sp.]